MTEAEKIFLVVSEELNLSKAAQRMFVSHQNISQHIQKLEDKYRTKLIVRKPKIQLTAAGRELADTLQQIQMLELQMQLRINEQDEHFCGELSIGMPYSRSFILAPQIIERYRKQYPNVKVTFLEGNSGELIQKLLNGSLDMFVGVQHKPNARLGYDLLMNEKLYVVIPENLLREVFSDTFPQCVQSLTQGVDMAKLAGIPFAVSLPNAFLRSQIDNFLIKEHVPLNIVFESGNQEMQLRLCQKGLMASFCTQMHLYTIKDLNRISDHLEHLYVFPIKRLSATNSIFVVYHKDMYFSPYKKAMRSIIKGVLKEFELLELDDFSFLPNGGCENQEEQSAKQEVVR